MVLVKQTINLHTVQLQTPEDVTQQRNKCPPQGSAPALLRSKKRKKKDLAHVITSRFELCSGHADEMPEKETLLSVFLQCPWSSHSNEQQALGS